MSDINEKNEDGATSSTQDAHGHGDHPATNLKAYFVVFFALCGFTTVSVFANLLARGHIITPFTSFAIILAVAFVKAVLVAMYFMHLITDWRKVYVFIIPTLVLAPMLVIVLLPDIVLAWTNAPWLAQ